ncbi:DNA topoisomerase 1 alpha-like isoform X1 [Humulus lupulus]|uniref:DNA topoisomerase 1 alpha-like isoform X1 n=2 Tax=Humulus lupulus TaxID=3486 RepID=UPI002B40D657|nr:DNA topoisomerase 1 alpha-like isoform X1 [Humulus lupulus]XP_062102051.1 DNA topoisomerase 1 alpha-like isoform X1 [Humulus lupulus]XP_062102052.1 DNA topoisomerase 1 alpha-like isoform X1 [Humulus lupulus]
MAVQAPAKMNLVEDFDDDDKPLTFKRSVPTSKQNQLNSEVKRPLSQRPDGLSARPVSGRVGLNGLNSSSQKGKVVQSIKGPSVVKSPIGSPKASTVRTTPMKSPVTNSVSSSSLVGQSKSSSERNKSSVVKEERSSAKQPIKSEDHSDDSDDNVPLSVRLNGSTSQGNKGLRKPMTGLPTTKSIVKKPPDDSDDEPLSNRFQAKPKAGTSGSKPNDCSDKKPLLSTSKQNGSTTTDGKKPLNSSMKRPLDREKSDNSSVKKPKLSDSPALVKNKQVSVKAESKVDDDDDDHVPISQRIKKTPVSNNNTSTSRQKVTKTISSSFKKNTKFKKVVKNSKYSKSTKWSPSSGDGQKKWTTLEHNGVIFPPAYQPHGVKMLYNGKPVVLTPAQEEVATMFAVMKDTEYALKEVFRENFWNDWRKLLGKNHVIQKLDFCDFTPIYDWYQNEKEKKKQMSSDEKKALKEEKLKQEEKYMWAIVDGVKEKVGNFRVEPPGLFRGRGEHPKSGKLKRRIRPIDVTINIGKDAPVPECPIAGERWKEVRHDNTVTWLAFWNDPINPKEFKYVFLAASSSLKGQSDKEKYEKARMLKGYIQNIRTAYTKDFTSKDVTKRQIAVATYLIDKLALRAGNEKDDDEADTVGCCTLKVENVKPIPPNKLEFNFLGKDSIRYENTVEVELPVYKAIMQFQTGKKGSDDLFDLLDTSKLNAHLKELMPGLTAKVFRTYNASITLDDMLSQETKDGDLEEKKTVYNTANKQVAIICNHQRTISKSHEAQMSRLMEKIRELEDVLKELKVDLDRAKKGKPPLKDAEGKTKRNLNPEALEKKIAQTNTKIEKIKRDMHNKEDTKTVALGTSKINYLDPRITVAWCKRHEVPIEKIFNKSLLAKFAWAMDVDPDFRF